MSDFNEISKEEVVFQHLYRLFLGDIFNCLYQSKLQRGFNVPVAMYLLYKVSQLNVPKSVTFEAVINGSLDIRDEIRDLVGKQFDEKFWEALLNLIEKYETNFLARATLKAIETVDDRIFGFMITPPSILRLVHRLLGVTKDDKVADICCGCGSYFLSAIDVEREAKYFGYDINQESIAMVHIIVDLTEAEINVALCDVFSLASQSDKVKFNKIFSNYPFGIKVRNLGEGYEYFKKISDQYPELSKATSSDWIFNALLCELLEENGKAVGIMTNGSTWNTIDTPMRKYFVERKMIECVISLPNRMFTSTVIPTTIIVLSNDNEAVRMIDATKICQQGRRQNELSEENIETLVNALDTDTSFSKLVTIDELRNNDYVLNLSRYVQEELSFENGVAFESIIKNITRGAQCTASQLDELVSDRVTNMQYLMLGNIKNGMIDEKLPYISGIDAKQEKYCLKNNSLILSKNGYPYKVAIASVKEGQKILANGNLYIIELNEERANPYYIKAFFESVQGIAALKSITVGATIPNIGVDKLKKIIIPLPSIDEQNRIAQKYQDVLSEITAIKKQLEETTNKLQHIFDSTCKE